MTIDPKSTIGGRMSQAARRQAEKITVEVTIPVMEVTMEYTSGVPDDEKLLHDAKRRAVTHLLRQFHTLEAKIIRRE